MAMHYADRHEHGAWLSPQRLILSFPLFSLWYGISFCFCFVVHRWSAIESAILSAQATLGFAASVTLSVGITLGMASLRISAIYLGAFFAVYTACNIITSMLIISYSSIAPMVMNNLLEMNRMHLGLIYLLICITFAGLGITGWVCWLRRKPWLINNKVV